MFKRTVLAIALSVAMLTPALATNVGAMNCKAWGDAKHNPAERAVMVTWLRGYLDAQSDTLRMLAEDDDWKPPSFAVALNAMDKSCRSDDNESRIGGVAEILMQHRLLQAK